MEGYNLNFPSKEENLFLIIRISQIENKERRGGHQLLLMLKSKEKKGYLIGSTFYYQDLIENMIENYLSCFDYCLEKAIRIPDQTGNCVTLSFIFLYLLKKSRFSPEELLGIWISFPEKERNTII